jgi:hypothetical protein
MACNHDPMSVSDNSVTIELELAYEVPRFWTYLSDKSSDGSHGWSDDYESKEHRC